MECSDTPFHMESEYLDLDLIKSEFHGDNFAPSCCADMTPLSNEAELPFELQNIQMGDPLPDSPLQLEDYVAYLDPFVGDLEVEGGLVPDEAPSTTATTSTRLPQPCGVQIPSTLTPSAHAQTPDADRSEHAQWVIERRVGPAAVQAPTQVPQTTRQAPRRCLNGEVKKERRREQNRRAARKCRDKKKIEENIMFQSYDGVVKENAQLKCEVATLKEQIQMLEEMKRTHTCPCSRWLEYD